MDTHIKNGSTGRRSKSSDQSDLTILVVDDDSRTLKSLHELVALEVPDSRIDVASTSSQAMSHLLEKAPDIALIDIQLGQENGVDLLAWIKKRYPDCVCLMMSASQDPSYTLAALRNRADDLYFKPINDHTFKESFRNHIYQLKKRVSQKKSGFVSDLVFSLSTHMMVILNAEGNIEDINEAGLKYFNRDKHSVLGEALFGLPWPNKVQPILRALLTQTLIAGRAEYETTANHIRAGMYLNFRMVRYGTEKETKIFLEVNNLGSSAGNKDGVIEALINDPLTGVLNRISFLAQTKQHCETNCDNCDCALFFLDIDNFKHINDMHGHYVGDCIIKDIAKRILGCIKATDLIGRYAGDEFVVLINGFQTKDDISIIAKRILNKISEPINIEGVKIHTSASIGIIISKQITDDVSDLINRADQAMYRAKINGRNRYEFFSKEMSDTML